MYQGINSLNLGYNYPTINEKPSNLELEIIQNPNSCKAQLAKVMLDILLDEVSEDDAKNYLKCCGYNNIYILDDGIIATHSGIDYEVFC